MGLPGERVPLPPSPPPPPAAVAVVLCCQVEDTVNMLRFILRWSSRGRRNSMGGTGCFGCGVGKGDAVVRTLRGG